ncbi:ATP-binding protein [Pseudolysobacter antarcticus]|uniref:ATP-binding protein n=1 Tax=Pseudolysobacter antarcticus TaxID=2511995 RepID=A0A411HJH5_9GAMM|nr:ATP-binding protein [Pseudolysobacter antarcticus]QBB70537.1 ATP-binding protein [Pseudolysobacter antarcticus]
MPIDPWLPRGFTPKDGIVLHRCVSAGDRWQIYESSARGRILVAQTELADAWVDAGLLSSGLLFSCNFGPRGLRLLEGGRGHRLEPVDEAAPPSSLSECQAFAGSLAASRLIDSDSGFHDALYVERLSRLVPSYTPAPAVEDLLVAGFWMTGGVNISLNSVRRMRALMPWLSGDQLKTLVGIVDGHPVLEPLPIATPNESLRVPADVSVEPDESALPTHQFSLPGRPLLETFFNEHVVDIIRNHDRYKTLGIDFPGAILLHGPPGCGKTFAIEQLVTYLDWPCFSVDSGSIGSPFIHETGRKISEIFAQAAKASPSIIVIDEIDAFLAARDGGMSGQHRVEEVAEFLRGIPKATNNSVLVVGMTNRLESLDPAAVRRGRFDHIIEVGMPSEQEVFALLSVKFAAIPHDPNVDLTKLAKELAGRPLSDLGFIVRESCRLSAKAGRSRVEAGHVVEAIESTPSRVQQEDTKRRIGFV